MILVPLGPAQRKEGGRKGAEEEEGGEEEGQKQNNTTKKTHVRRQHQHRTSTTSTRERGRWENTCRQRERARERWRERGENQHVGWRWENGRVSEGGQGDNSYKNNQKQNKGERVVLLCSHSPSPALSAGHPPAQGGFFGPMRAAAQWLCVIGRLQESKEDT